MFDKDFVSILIIINKLKHKPKDLTGWKKNITLRPLRQWSWQQESIERRRHFY